MKYTICINQKITNGNYLFQILATATSALYVITSGMHDGWPSPSLPKLENSTLAINGNEGSWIAVMPLIGAIIGSLIAFTIVDILGRKRTIILTTFPLFAAWIMVAFAKSVTLLDIARFIAGLADGWIFTAVPMYVAEIADPHIRGSLGVCVSATWVFGMLIINVIGGYTTIQTAALISSVFPVLSLLTFIWMPESPYYYVMRGQFEEAERSLKTFSGKDDITSDFERITTAVKAQTENTDKFLDLFKTKSNRKALYITAGLHGAQQLSGTIAIAFYSQMIFCEAGHVISSRLASIIYFSTQFLLTMFCSSIVDKAGRRPLLILSITGSAIALFIEGTYFYLKLCTNINVTQFAYIPMVSLLVFVVMFSLGMQSIPTLMLGELFPANVKAFALGLTQVYFCVTATIASKFLQIMKDSFGIYVPFYAFTLSCLLGLIFIIFCVPETKGKTLEEIQLYLGGKAGKIVRNRDDRKIDEIHL